MFANFSISLNKHITLGIFFLKRHLDSKMDLAQGGPRAKSKLGHLSKSISVVHKILFGQGTLLVKLFDNHLVSKTHKYNVEVNSYLILRLN